jgi:cytochrome c551/c552
VNCHSPANVLDLAGATGASEGNRLGVECTPNILRNPAGTIPSARSDDVEMGVDCTACHVSERGIVGPGRHSASVHEVVADTRFQVPASASETLCQTCHRASVDAWKRSTFPAQGVTCLDCHMPKVTAPSVTQGPERARRSHRFAADKDPAMLARAMNVSLEITGDRKAVFRLANTGVGHYLPSGGNWLSVLFQTRDASGRLLRERKEVFGRDEALVLDVWPFNRDFRLAPGEHREIVFSLPDGSGSVDAAVRYHDWMRVSQTVLTLTRRY